MEICVFRWGKGGQRFIRDTRWVMGETLSGGREWWYKVPEGSWKRRKKCVSGYTGQTCYMGQSSTPVRLDRDAFDQVVEGTRWKECLDNLPWTNVSSYADNISLMDRVSRNPCVEYLLRLGDEGLARLVVDGMAGMLLNKRGKTARQVLRLTTDEWGWVKGNRVTVTPELLEIIQKNRARGYGLGMEMCRRVADNRDLYAVEQLREHHPGIPLKAALKYAYRQHARLGDYLDYLRQCSVLGADLTARQVLWPTNLHEIPYQWRKRHG
ncbi:MAG: hypothetical protein ACI4MJ_01175 [Aristaeellaceae bacterium]